MEPPWTRAVDSGPLCRESSSPADQKSREDADCSVLRLPCLRLDLQET